MLFALFVYAVVHDLFWPALWIFMTCAALVIPVLAAHLTDDQPGLESRDQIFGLSPDLSRIKPPSATPAAVHPACLCGHFRDQHRLLGRCRGMDIACGLPCACTRKLIGSDILK